MAAVVRGGVGVGVGGDWEGKGGKRHVESKGVEFDPQVLAIKKYSTPISCRRRSLPLHN